MLRPMVQPQSTSALSLKNPPHKSALTPSTSLLAQCLLQPLVRGDMLARVKSGALMGVDAGGGSKWIKRWACPSTWWFEGAVREPVGDIGPEQRLHPPQNE